MIPLLLYICLLPPPVGQWRPGCIFIRGDRIEARRVVFYAEIFSKGNNLLLQANDVCEEKGGIEGREVIRSCCFCWYYQEQ